nr:hypothetical protein [Actinokineospora spheciospongiae]
MNRAWHSRSSRCTNTAGIEVEYGRSWRVSVVAKKSWLSAFLMPWPDR